MVQELKHKPEMMLSTKIMVLSFYTRNHKPCRVSRHFSTCSPTINWLNLISAGCLIYLKHMMNPNSSWNCFDPIRTQPYPSLNMLKLSYLKDLWGTFLEIRSEMVKQTLPKKTVGKLGFDTFGQRKEKGAQVFVLMSSRYSTDATWPRCERESLPCAALRLAVLGPPTLLPNTTFHRLEMDQQKDCNNEILKKSLKPISTQMPIHAPCCARCSKECKA